MHFSRLLLLTPDIGKMRSHMCFCALTFELYAFWFTCVVPAMTDIIEPPWMPANPLAKPFNLKVYGITLPDSSSSPGISPLPSPNPFPSLSLTLGVEEITKQTFCGQPTQSPSPLLAGSACPDSMPRLVDYYYDLPDQLPPPVDCDNCHWPKSSSVVNASLDGHLLLALPRFLNLASGLRVPIAASWSRPTPTTGWSRVVGPTARRWMLDDYSIRLGKSHLRRNDDWSVGDPLSNFTQNLNRYEQTPITVTANLYTQQPDTGQRIYLLNSATNSQPTDLDVTQLVPNWALHVQPSSESSSATKSQLSAYIHREPLTQRPFLIGRIDGRATLNLKVDPNDRNPLTRALINVGDELSSGGGNRRGLQIVGLRAECIDPNIKLSGHLDPAPLLPGSTAVPSHSFKSTLPNPHRLTIELHGTSDPSNGGSVIIASASSTMRTPSSLRNLMQRLNSSRSRSHRHSEDPKIDSFSSAECPIDRLTISILFSDGSIQPTHQLPPNQLRISVIGTKLVWDPSSLSSSARPEQGYVSVPINHLLLWTAFNIRHSQLLGAMDDAIAMAHSRRFQLSDPGPQLSGEELAASREDDDTQLKDDNAVDQETSLLNSKRKNVWFNANRMTQFHVGRDSSVASNFVGTTPSDSTSATSTTTIAYILVGVGCICTLLFLVNCSILIGLRRRKRQRSPTSDKPTHTPLQPNTNSIDEPIAYVNRHAVELGPLMNGSHSPSSPSYNHQHQPIYSQQNGFDRQLRSPDSFNGSIETGSIEAPLKNSVFIDSPGCPTRYLTASTPNSHAPVNPQSWMPVPNSLQSNDGRHPASIDVGHANGLFFKWTPDVYRHTNGGGGSGIGSVGTVEGCSDEGVALGFEPPPSHHLSVVHPHSLSSSSQEIGNQSGLYLRAPKAASAFGAKSQPRAVGPKPSWESRLVPDSPDHNRQVLISSMTDSFTGSNSPSALKHGYHRSPARQPTGTTYSPIHMQAWSVNSRSPTGVPFGELDDTIVSTSNVGIPQMMLLNDRPEGQQFVVDQLLDPDALEQLQLTPNTAAYRRSDSFGMATKQPDLLHSSTQHPQSTALSSESPESGCFLVEGSGLMNGQTSCNNSLSPLKGSPLANSSLSAFDRCYRGAVDNDTIAFNPQPNDFQAANASHMYRQMPASEF